ncbi:DUF2141 domain-containing protein [Pseudaquidulcibacter saccharophilus]|uniref:DUF2141 domain-containing protein n=1 Tax=Pseudaquidulcibacter saccharophilus TaxID=2831900 RepID=UPI001EFF46F5|nr:DUF2141 domain-containing protein [Pseudaquidulcibacter saccharophilus]
MKNIIKISILALTTFATSAFAQEATFPLTVQLNGLESEDGMIMACVSRQENYDKFGCDYRAAVKVEDLKNNQFTIENIAKGKYAIRIFHDLNGNMKLDTNAMGIPKEPWAASNNAKGNFGPPKFDDAAIDVNGATVTKITIE